MSFTDAELQRYARHLMLPEIGGPGQQALRKARILLIGAGGLGSPAALYLAAAGIGTLGLVDDDTVSLSNLQRQILHGTADVGRSKLDSARDRIAALNPHVSVVAHSLRLTRDNGADLLAGYDLVIDGSDNFDTRYAAAELCERMQRPLVQAAVQRFSGSLTLLAPFATLDGAPAPRLTDLFPSPPPDGTVPSCAEAGILGVTTGILGTLAAAEAIKHVCGIGEPLIGRLLMVDVLAMRFTTIRYRRSGPPGTQG
ncbi:HesA/MoeB/ThiF family protein [Aureimonas frigidaquae]|uniref:Molybdopterin-synthase adenylyltransferase n=1 Tax=Aureimonas frigidaquae TaxID=424757 RepID=A0A0N7KXK7_9HYPH|nr:molybdopterin-synthase adenylyltransferase MoeB [Aureimonas frigidaquae]BAT27193.1 molybdopterin biosynthesis protein MoeB [Aureimonas frigidaquae]